MRKRPFFLFAVMFFLGVLFRDIKSMFIIAIFLSVFAAFTLKFIKKVSVRKRIAISFLISVLIPILIPFVLGYMRMDQQTKYRSQYLKTLSDDEDIIAQGLIYKKEQKPRSYCYYLENVYIKKKDSTKITQINNILVYFKNDKYPVGKTIAFRGKVSLFEEARNEGNFEAKDFYQSQKIDFSVQNPVVYKKSIKHDKYLNALYSLKLNLREVYATILKKDNAGVLVNMLLGDKSLLDEDVKNLYQRMGLSHILAISGMHVSFFGLGYYFFLRKTGLSNKKSAAISVFTVVSYGYLTGMGLSSIRAIGMIVLMIVGNLIGRTYDVVNSLGIMMLYFLWNNPFVYKHPGIQLSFAAVFSIVTVGKILSIKAENETKLLKRKLKKYQIKNLFKSKKIRRTLVQYFAKKMKQSVLISLGIWLGTLPLVLNSYYEIPTYAIIINLALLPFLEVVFISGIAGGIVGMLVIWIAKFVLFPADKILDFYDFIGRITERLPKSTLIIGKPSLLQILVYYGVLLLFILILWKRNEVEEAKKELNIPEKERKYFKSNVVVVLILLAIICYRKPLGLEIDMLDVGQGDGLYISTSDNYNYFIDGGSTDQLEVGKYRMIPFLKSKGIKKIDYWFLSHGDSDHLSGLEEALDSGYEVDNLVLSKMMPKDNAYKTLIKKAKANRTKILHLDHGDNVATKHTKVTVLFPNTKTDFTEAERNDRNILSLGILLQDRGFSGVFAGDMNGEQEDQLFDGIKEVMPKNQHIDFFKATHHGSRFSNTIELLEKITPTYVGVSCGKGNRYGHPHQEAIDNYKKVNSKIFYTMKAGQIKIRREKNNLVVKQKLSMIQ